MTPKADYAKLRFSRPFNTSPLLPPVAGTSDQRERTERAEPACLTSPAAARGPAQYLTITEAAKYLGVCCRELKDLIRAGLVHRVSLAPGEFRITRASLDAERNRRNKMKKGPTHDPNRNRNRNLH